MILLRHCFCFFFFQHHWALLQSEYAPNKRILSLWQLSNNSVTLRLLILSFVKRIKTLVKILQVHCILKYLAFSFLLAWAYSELPRSLMWRKSDGEMAIKAHWNIEIICSVQFSLLWNSLLQLCFIRNASLSVSTEMICTKYMPWKTAITDCQFCLR